jgi:hypothetical protein
VADAGWQRARAARIRDEGGEHADWAIVDQLLAESYRNLAQAVSGRPQ